MRIPTLSLRTLTIISLFLASSGAFADNDKGCSGLGNNGDYAKKLQERQGSGGQKTIGKSKIDDLRKQNDQIKQKLQACQQNVGNGLSIFNYNQIEERFNKAADTWKGYVADQNEICHKYGQYTGDVEKRANDMKKTAELSQKEYFTATADMHRKNTGNYGGLERYAADSGKKVQQGLPGNEKDGDPRMYSAIKSFRGNLENQIKSLEDQARKKLTERSAQADGEVVVGKMRFKTQADVDKFYKGTDQCKQALKDLEKFGEKYKKLSGDLAEAQQEAKDAENSFKQKKDESWKQTNDMQEQANKLDEGGDKSSNSTATQAETKPEATPNTHDKTTRMASEYPSSVQDDLISKGADPNRGKGAGSVLGTFEKDGQWYTVYGAKSYNGNTPYYAKPGLPK